MWRHCCLHAQFKSACVESPAESMLLYRFCVPGALIPLWLQVWQIDRLLTRTHFEAWKASAIGQHESRAVDVLHVVAQFPASASAASSAPVPPKIVPQATAAAASSAQLYSNLSQAPSLLKYSSPAILLKYFNAWFTFANVSQWSRDLHLEHDYARLKSAWLCWKAACRRLRPRFQAPLSPDSFAAAGVQSLMPQAASRAPRSLRSAQPSDVAISLDLVDSDPPVPPATEAQRPGSRRLVTPDDSARIMFFFGQCCPSKRPCCCTSYFNSNLTLCLLHHIQACFSRRSLLRSFGPFGTSSIWACGDATLCTRPCARSSHCSAPQRCASFDNVCRFRQVCSTCSSSRGLVDAAFLLGFSVHDDVALCALQVASWCSGTSPTDEEISALV